MTRKIVSGVLYPYNSEKSNAQKSGIPTNIDIYSYRRAHRPASCSAGIICRSCGVVVKKFPAFNGTQRFITAFKSSHHMSYPEPHRSSPCPDIPLPEFPSKYYPPIYAWVFQVVTFPQVFPPQPCILLYSPPCVLHAVSASFISI